MKQYLENLIKVVNEDDWKKLKDINLKASKLKDFLHILLDNRNGELPSNPEIQARLKIDDKLHRKMKSVLLSKCYEALVPEGKIRLLELLSRYRLYDHFTRELEKQEKSVRRKSDKERREFYNFAFQGLRRLPYSLVDVALMEEFGKKYLKTVEKKNLREETLIIKLRILVLKILLHYFHLDTRITAGEIKEELQLLKKSVTEKPTQTLEVLLNYVTGIYHFYIDSDYEKSITFLLKTKKLAGTNNADLTYDEWAALEVFIALNYYQANGFREAIGILEEAYRNYPAMMKNQTHVINRMIELYLIEGRLHDAKVLLDDYLHKFLDIAESDSAELASISYIKYFLLTNELDKAFEYLDKARKFLNKKFYLGHDIEVRTLEILYFVYSGDYAFAKSLISRGIKYLHEKSKEKEVRLALEKYRLLQKLCKFSDADKPSIEMYSQEVLDLFSGYDRLIGLLVLKGCKARLEKVEM